MRTKLCASTQRTSHERSAPALFAAAALARDIGELAPEPEHGVLKVVAHVGLAHARQLCHAGLVRVGVGVGVGVRVGVRVGVTVMVTVLG